MTLTWMLYALGVGALVAIAAASAEWALKSAGRSVRFVWAAAIAITLAFTVLAPFRMSKPQTQIALPAATLVETTNAVVIEPSLFERLQENGRRALALVAVPVEEVLSLSNRASRTVHIGAGVLWMLSAVATMLAMFAVYSRSMRESARWPRVKLFDRSVRVAPDVGPAVMGVAPAEIVIPRWVLMRNETEQRLVLEHESEHVRAHDPLLLVFACVAIALMPWNLAVWFMWSRLRLAVELDCDRRVLQRGVQKPAYGELLVELSSQRPWNSLAMPAFSWGASHLEKRLVAMTARPARFSVARRVLSGSVVAVALLAACQAELPTAAQVQAMSVKDITARVPMTADSTVYYVNGKLVSKAEAEAILSDDIASIEVKKAATKVNGVSEIHITLAEPGQQTRKSALIRTDSAPVRVAVRGVKGSGTMRIVGDSLELRSADSTRGMVITGGRMTLRTDTAQLTNLGTATANCPSRDLPPTGQGGARVLVRAQGPNCTAGKPLIVVDGVVLAATQTLDGINPNNIESVEVIKGAAAQAAWGARAADGVIVIKTKNN